MDIDQLYTLYKNNYKISTDSRNIIPGSIFFALKGEKFDGNLYASEALQKGATYAVIDNPDFKKNEQFLLVKDCLNTLQKLANYHRKKLGIPVFAITGTNGKTTTRELIAAVLNTKFRVVATQGNLNNHIGVPLTLLSMTNDTEIGVVEMGANHIGEIEQLCNIAEPDFGMITNIGKAHLEGFGSYKNVIRAKSEIYSYLINKKGTIFYNIDNPLLKELVKKTNCISIDYGINSKYFNNVRLLHYSPFLNLSITTFADKNKPEDITISTNLVGEYNLENVLASVCAGMYFGISVNIIIKSIQEYSPMNNRSQFIKTQHNRLILDYYNANPTSMEAAIINFHEIETTDSRKILVLGEMLELGVHSMEEHFRILMIAEKMGFDDIYFVGKGFKIVDQKKYLYFENSDLLKNYLKVNKVENALILIKGSRGVKLENITEVL